MDEDAARELARLIKKRGTYKGHQTKAVTKLAGTDTLATADIDFNMLDNMIVS